MKLIKTNRGYVNADVIEELAIVRTDKYTINGGLYDVVACAPTYNTNFPEVYVLAEKCTKKEAQIRIDTLAERLTKYRNGIFDAMNVHIEEDDDDQDIDE